MLWGVLWFLGWVLAFVLALVVAVLATPVKFGFTFSTSPGWRLLITMRLFGGFAPVIPLHDSSRRRPKAKKKPVARRRRLPARFRLSAARIRRGILAAPDLLAGLLRPIRLERLALDADIGLADPADTGQLFGFIAAVNHSRPAASAVSIEVRPDFTGPRASGELDAVLSFIPVAFVPPGLRFAWRVFGASS